MPLQHPFSNKMRFNTLVFVFVLSIIILGIQAESLSQNLAPASSNDVETARRRKKGGKYLGPLLFAALMIKSIVFPLAFKAMAAMSSTSILLSIMSLVIASLVGYYKTTEKPNTSVKVFHKNPYSGWAKDDTVYGPVENYNTIIPPPPQ